MKQSFKMLQDFKDDRSIYSNAVDYLYGYIQYLWLVFWNFIFYPLRKLMPSRHTLKDELDQAQTALPSQRPDNTNKAPDLQKRSSDADTTSESGEIEVIHDRQLPKLHGILKQRTLSESSDDLNCNSYKRQSSDDCNSYNRQLSSGNESINLMSESDENVEHTSRDECVKRERKKSVSFSEHVDSTSFKQNQSVSSMRQTLKNKRKKQRRNEKRHQGRRRRNSNSVSELSSDEVTADDTYSTNCTENRSHETSRDFTSLDMPTGNTSQSIAQTSSKKITARKPETKQKLKGDKENILESQSSDSYGITSEEGVISSNKQTYKTKCNSNYGIYREDEAKSSSVNVNCDVTNKQSAHVNKFSDVKEEEARTRDAFVQGKKEE